MTTERTDERATIRVVLVEDHAVVRSGLQQLLSTTDDIVVVASAADGSEALGLVRAHDPDVVLMDLSMPVMDGVTATRAVLAERPETTIVVLTSFSDTAKVAAAIDAGARGYQLKDAAPDDLIAAIRAAAVGGAPLDPRAAAIILDRNRRSASPDPGVNLSQRETEVLLLVTRGLANKQIARKLGIAERTVKAHLTNVFAALGVTDRTQAALWARDHLDT